MQVESNINPLQHELNPTTTALTTSSNIVEDVSFLNTTTPGNSIKIVTPKVHNRAAVKMITVKNECKNGVGETEKKSTSHSNKNLPTESEKPKRSTPDKSKMSKKFTLLLAF